MKNKSRLTTIFVLGLAIFISLACQISSQAAPNSEPEPVMEPTTTNPPTEVPTETPLPTPDLSTAVLTLDDLPPGFDEYNLADMGMTEDDFSDETFKPEEVFIFINSQEFQMVFGFNFLLIEKLERATFDLGISQPELTLPALVNGMGSENIQDEKILEGLEDVGEVQIGMTMIANMEGVPAQVDVLMFRRDVVGAMVMSMVLEGQTPNIALHELGLKLDQHIQESLQTIQ